jgi:hypothetical protein
LADVTSVSGTVGGSLPVKGLLSVCGTHAAIWELFNDNPYPNWPDDAWQVSPVYGGEVPGTVWYNANSSPTYGQLRTRPSLNAGSSGVVLRSWVDRVTQMELAIWEWPQHCVTTKYYDLRDVSSFEGQGTTHCDPAWTVGTNGVILKRRSAPRFNEFWPVAVSLSGQVAVRCSLHRTELTDHVYIYRSTSEDGPWSLAHTEDVPVSHPDGWVFTWTDPYNFLYSIPYFYKVAVSATPEWEYMKVVSAIPGGLPNWDPPAWPANFQACDVPGDNGWRILLTWSPTATFSHIYRQLISSMSQQPEPFEYIGCSSSDRFVDVHALPGATYKYRLRSFDGVTHSEPSQTGGMSFDDLPPPKMQAPVVAHLNDPCELVHVRWSCLGDDEQDGPSSVGGYSVNVSFTPDPVAQDLNRGPILFPSRCFLVSPSWKGRWTYWRVRAMDRSDNYGPYSPAVALFIPRNPQTDDGLATAMNNGRKLARAPNDTVFNIGFQGYGTARYTWSKDGDSWRRCRPVDWGDASSIASASPDQTAYAFVKDNGLWVALRNPSGNWDRRQIFSGDSMVVPHSPSLFAPPPSAASTAYYYVAFSVSDQGASSSQIWLAKFDQYQTHLQKVSGNYSSPTESLPCVAVTPGDLVHVAWQRDNRILYAVALIPPEQWSDFAFDGPVEISPGGTPARHPFIEAFGEFVYAVWQDAAHATIEQSCHHVWAPVDDWLSPVTLSDPSSPADYPVCSKCGVAAWQQRTPAGSEEVWCNVLGSLVNVSETPDSASRYPHLDVSLHCSDGTLPVVDSLYAIWTEEYVRDSLWEIGSRKLGFSSWGAGPSATPALRLACGQEKPSVYCRRREGRREHRGHRFDYSRDSLAYELRYLDNRYRYVARLVFIHDGVGEFTQTLRAGSVELARVRFRSSRSETLTVVIPEILYDGKSTLALGLHRTGGSYAALVSAELFAFEDRSHRNQVGGQSARRMDPTIRIGLADPAPNPFSGLTSIRYATDQEGVVCLRAFDLSGKRVRTLVNQTQRPGRYSLTWDARGDRMNRLPEGVYFLAYRTLNHRQTRKVVLTR